MIRKLLFSLLTPKYISPSVRLCAHQREVGVQLGSYSSVSFYKLCNPTRVSYAPDTLCQTIKYNLQKFDVRGTFYVANEGINAQLCIRESEFASFQSTLLALNPFFNDLDLSNFNTKRYETVESLPFRKLIVRTKKQVLTDGLIEDDNNLFKFDWSDPGIEINPSQWHEEVILANRHPADTSPTIPNSNSFEDFMPKTVILDCRNDFESNLGTFQGSIPLNTTSFSGSWEQLDKVVGELAPNTRILTFCTGGIRCVKVNAYLRQKHGLSNLARLKHGIIGYQNWWNQHHHAQQQQHLGTVIQAPIEASGSTFIGKNYLFNNDRILHM